MEFNFESLVDFEGFNSLKDIFYNFFNDTQIVRDVVSDLIYHVELGDYSQFVSSFNTVEEWKVVVQFIIFPFHLLV